MMELYRLKGVISGLQVYGITCNLNDNWISDGITAFSLCRKGIRVERVL